MPGAGVEPARPEGHPILSRARLTDSATPASAEDIGRRVSVATEKLVDSVWRPWHARRVSADVFISHSTNDAVAAREVCDALERAAVTCWIAPRDIEPGRSWPGAIVEGLDASRVVIVVVSQASIESDEVLREVERAATAQKTLVPLRIDAHPLSGGLAFFLSSRQWFDAASPPVQPRLDQLAEAVRSILGRTVAPVAAPPPDPGPPEVDIDDWGRSGRRRSRFARIFDDR